MRVAVLDPNGFLIGVNETDKPTRKAIDAGDLPANGSYKYDAPRGCFIPKGFGHGKPNVPPVDRDHAVYLLITSVHEGRPVPQECLDWAAWWKRYNERRGG